MFQRTNKQCFKYLCVHQVPVNPSLYLIKYDGFDCVYGLELHKDERVQGLEVLPDRLGKINHSGDGRLHTLHVFVSKHNSILHVYYKTL